MLGRFEKFAAPLYDDGTVVVDREAVREIRMRLYGVLEPRESILFYGERDLLVFMPGVSSEQLPTRIRSLRETFHRWHVDQLENQRNARMNLGFSVCEGDEDLSRTLEVASLVMHPESDDESDASAEF